jgi:hypothetical protein
MDKSEGNQTRGLLGCCWKCFPHTKGRKKKRGEESYYIVEEYYIGKREGGEKERTLFIELPTISKMDAPVQHLIWLELPLSFVQIFRGKRMLSSFWRVCVSTMII